MNSENKPKRPASVWIAQILLLLVAVLFLLMQLFVVVSVSFPSLPIMLIGLAMIVVVMVALPITSFVGMAKRKSWGRWLAVGFLSFLFIFSALAQIAQPKGPIEYYEYENTTQLIAGIVTQIVILGPLLFLILRLAFGKKVSRFLSKNPVESETIETTVNDLNP